MSNQKLIYNTPKIPTTFKIKTGIYLIELSALDNRYAKLKLDSSNFSKVMAKNYSKFIT